MGKNYSLIVSEIVSFDEEIETTLEEFESAGEIKFSMAGISDVNPTIKDAKKEDGVWYHIIRVEYSVKD